MLIGPIVRARTWWCERSVALGDEAGATAVEYAIMLAFIAAVIVAAVAALGQATNNGFQTVRFP